MRDPNRQGPILNEIKRIWSTYPDLRLGQLLLNVLNEEDSGPAYYVEDDVLLNKLRAYYTTTADPANDARAAIAVLKELRAALKGYTEGRFPGPFEIRPSLVREAADEIEKLLAVVERVQAWTEHDDHGDDTGNAELQANIHGYQVAQEEVASTLAAFNNREGGAG